jgi:Uncharacterized conserved protein
MPYDFKKEFKDLYQPKDISVTDVPEMLFIMIDGKGDPNTSADYLSAVEVLYGLSYSIKMSKMSGKLPEGYFDYVVPPLEGLWNYDDGGPFRFGEKNKFVWTSMIRQPEFVTREIFEAAKTSLLKKKPELDLSKAKLEKFKEGLCVQALHTGPYDGEPATIAKMEKFILENGYSSDFGFRRHHEIYLSDPRKTETEKLKTIIRQPIKR